MGVEAAQEAWPVQVRTTSAEYVGNVCAVIMLPLFNQRLFPNHLFRRAKSHGHAHNCSLNCVRKPLLIDVAEAIPRAKDDIDKILAAEDFSQPVGKREIGVISGRGQDLENTATILLEHENVEIFRRAHDTGVAFAGIGPANEKGYPRCTQSD